MFGQRLVTLLVTTFGQSHERCPMLVGTIASNGSESEPDGRDGLKIFGRPLFNNIQDLPKSNEKQC